MIILRTIKEALSGMGFGSNHRPFNKIQLKIAFIFISSIITHCIYLFHGSKTPKQYMDAILMTSEPTFIFIAFLSSIYQMENISRFIDMLEKVVEKRKLNVEIIKINLASIGIDMKTNLI